MSFLLLRHGMTKGNAERRYIGSRTDEPLSPEGIAVLRARDYPPVSAVLCSPMTRCLQTAAIAYPNLAPRIVPDFRECDFGAFEGLNYQELNGRADYQAWIDSGGETAFPGGESRADFARRCAEAFARTREEIRGDCAVIVHGGTIMAIMERFALPRGGYFDFQVPNGSGYWLRDDGSYERFL